MCPNNGCIYYLSYCDYDYFNPGIKIMIIFKYIFKNNACKDMIWNNARNTQIVGYSGISSSMIETNNNSNMCNLLRY